MSFRPEMYFDFDASDFSTYLNKIIHEWSKTVVILVFVLVVFSAPFAKEDSMLLAVGTKAPDFSLKSRTRCPSISRAPNRACGLTAVRVTRFLCSR